MTTMFERVARAIYEKRNGHGCKSWTLLTIAHKDPYLSDARAAIEEMREPSEGVVISGSSTEMGLNPEDVKLGWQAMINAILTEA